MAKKKKKTPIDRSKESIEIYMGKRIIVIATQGREKRVHQLCYLKNTYTKKKKKIKERKKESIESNLHSRVIESFVDTSG